jgi:subtilisin-like proprotein convertase family protein
MGTFQPNTPLAAFDGTDANGVWTLLVYDGSAGDPTGYLGITLRVGTVAEPSTALLLGLALAGLGFSRHRKLH